MAVIFPDLEPLLIAHLRSSLTSAGYPDARVSVKKAPADETAPAVQIVVAANYAQTTSPVTREASAVVDVYADSYAVASHVALVVAGHILAATGESIKRVELVLGPVRQADEGPQEKRSMSVDMVVKGSDL